MALTRFADDATIADLEKSARRIAELEESASAVAAILHVISTWNITDDVQFQIEIARRRLLPPAGRDE